MLLEVGEDFEAVDAGHLEVEEEEVVGSGLDEEEGGGAVGGLVDLVALAFELMGATSETAPDLVLDVTQAFARADLGFL